MPQILAPPATGPSHPPGGVMFRWKAFYFDREAVKEAIRNAGLDPKRMKQAALKVRSEARRSMRRVKRKTTNAPPLSPPRSRAPEPNLRSIEAFFHPGDKMGYVGSAIFPGTKARIQYVPEVHEFGGSIALPQPVLKIRRGPKRNRRPTRKQKRALQKKLQQRAFFQKMHPDWDKRVYKTFHYPPRPYMWPALLRTIDLLPRMWRGSLRFRSIQEFDRRLASLGPSPGPSMHGGFSVINRAA